jgi:hypothetical protein
VKVNNWTVKFKNKHHLGEWVVLRLYVDAPPTGGSAPSRVFELSPDDAKSLGHDLSYWEVEP